MGHCDISWKVLAYLPLPCLGCQNGTGLSQPQHLGLLSQAWHSLYNSTETCCSYPAPLQPVSAPCCGVFRPDSSKRDSYPCRPVTWSLGIVSLLLGHLFPPTAQLASFLPSRSLGMTTGLGWAHCFALAPGCGVPGLLNLHLSSSLSAPWGTLQLQLEGLWLSRDGWK